MVLFLIAYVLFLPISLINYCFVVIIKDKSSKGYFRTSAVNIDRFANREFRTLFNATLKKEEGYEFGDFRETISSVLGKNQRDKTLSKTGKALVWILDKLDKNHCINSIDLTKGEWIDTRTK